jgi:hypothetical protein
MDPITKLRVEWKLFQETGEGYERFVKAINEFFKSVNSNPFELACVKLIDAGSYLAGQFEGKTELASEKWDDAVEHFMKLKSNPTSV